MSSLECSCWCHARCWKRWVRWTMPSSSMPRRPTGAAASARQATLALFAPVAQIVHLDGGGKSTVQIKSRMHVQMQKSHLIYALKHHGAVGYLVAKALFVASATLRVTAFSAVRLLRGGARAQAHIRLSTAALRYHLLVRILYPDDGYNIAGTAVIMDRAARGRSGPCMRNGRPLLTGQMRKSISDRLGSDLVGSFRHRPHAGVPDDPRRRDG